MPEQVVIRLKTVDATAQANVVRLNDALQPVLPEINRLVSRAQDTQLSAAARLSALREAGAVLSKAGSPVSACAKGCSHCCHIPVAVSPSEAKLIGQAIGRKPRKVRTAIEVNPAYGYDRPCTFLKKGRCSIHASRPLVCRTLLNLDADALLCELVPGMSIPVPYANANSLAVIYASICSSEGLAELRDFFPAGA